jgi:Spy/CpxP family protein refolding chaperone
LQIFGHFNTAIGLKCKRLNHIEICNVQKAKSTKKGGKMKKSIISFATFFLIVLFIQNSFAQKDKSRMERIEKGIKELNLTDVQKKKFKEIRFAQQEAKIDNEGKLKKNHLEIQKIIASNKIDEEKLMTLVSKANDIRGELQKTRIKIWLEMYNILDDSQKQIWVEHFERFGNERFMERPKRDFMRHERMPLEDDGPELE